MDIEEALVLFKAGQLMRRSCWPKGDAVRLELEAFFSKREECGTFTTWGLQHDDVIAEDWEPVEISA